MFSSFGQKLIEESASDLWLPVNCYAAAWGVPFSLQPGELGGQRFPSTDVSYEDGIDALHDALLADGFSEVESSDSNGVSSDVVGALIGIVQSDNKEDFWATDYHFHVVLNTEDGPTVFSKARGRPFRPVLDDSRTPLKSLTDDYHPLIVSSVTGKRILYMQIGLYRRPERHQTPILLTPLENNVNLVYWKDGPRRVSCLAPDDVKRMRRNTPHVS